MKKLIFLIILSVLFLGCDIVEDIPNPPVPHVIPKYKVIAVCDTTNGYVSPVEQLVDSAKNAEIMIIPKPGFATDSLFVNGKSSPLTSQNYTLKVTSDNNIRVTFKKTPLWYLIQKPWKTYFYQIKDVGVEQWRSSLSPPELPIKTYIYNENYRYEIFNNKNVLVGNGSYHYYPKL